MVVADICLLKWAFLALGAAAVLLCALFLAMFGLTVLWDTDRPQFPYELVISVAGVLYFGALSLLARRGLRHVLNESELNQTTRLLAQSVLGMFVPVAVVAAFMLWSVFHPASVY